MKHSHQPRGLNHGKYLGETIPIREVLSELTRLAAAAGWQSTSLFPAEPHDVVALVRRVPGAERSVYLSFGIHGDEPAGPLAALRLFETNPWPDRTDVYLCPCLNPGGFARNSRENPDGVDLNRDYLQPKSAEVQAHVAWIQGLPLLDWACCVHEDWESRGFYLYELNPDQRPSKSHAILDAVREVCPIDTSPTIEDREARDGLICLSVDPRSRPQWPEAFYLLEHKTRVSYTLEAPSDFDLDVRVNALVRALQTLLDLG